MRRSNLVVATSCCVLAFAGVSQGDVTYNFESGWPPSPTGLLLDQSFMTTDGIRFYNYTNNNLYWDDNYMAAKSEPRFWNILDQPTAVMWANPKFDVVSSPYLDIDLSAYNGSSSGPIKSISFDFAWALAGDSVPNELYIEAWDSNQTYFDFYAPLGSIFDPGPAYKINGSSDPGRSGRVNLGVSGTDLLDFDYLSIHLSPIETGNGTSEFAIDNFRVSSSEDPDDPSLSPGSNVRPGALDFEVVGISSNTLRHEGTFYFTFQVSNVGEDPTTITQALVSGSAGVESLGLQTNIPIGAGESIYPPPVASLEQDLPSGTYTATFKIHNELNSNDPDETIEYTYYLYDAPILSDNTGKISVNDGDSIYIANAAAAGHAGALRAGADVTSVDVGNSRFSINGIAVGDFIDDGEQQNATVSFNSVGALSGTYTTTLTIGLAMNSEPDPQPNNPNINSYLNNAQPLDSRVWTLQYVLADKTSASDSYESATPFDPQTLSINNERTAAAIVGGTASAGQTVNMSFQPGLAFGNVIGTPVDITFGSTPDQYVLQLTYSEADLPAGFDETSLRIFYFVEGDNAWVEAISANSDAGVGATFHLGAYSDEYFELSHFGVDPVNNRIWAVLDHNTSFAVGVPEPGSLGVVGLVALAGLRRRRRRAA